LERLGSNIKENIKIILDKFRRLQRNYGNPMGRRGIWINKV